MRLAFIYGAGPKVMKDWPHKLTEAARLYRVGCDQDIGEGCYETGVRYEFAGPGSYPKDLDRARALYTRACELGFAGACHALGAVYEQGRGTAKDAELAVQVLERGCFDLAYNFACRFGGGMFSSGRHLPKNLSLARKFYEHGCSTINDVMCCEELLKISKKNAVSSPFSLDEPD